METKEASVFDFQAYKTRKALQGERKIGLQQSFKAPEEQNDVRNIKRAPGADVDADLAARIERIKSSIHRINELMVELKSMSPRQDPKN